MAFLIPLVTGVAACLVYIIVQCLTRHGNTVHRWYELFTIFIYSIAIYLFIQMSIYGVTILGSIECPYLDLLEILGLTRVVISLPGYGPYVHLTNGRVPNGGTGTSSLYGYIEATPNYFSSKLATLSHAINFKFDGFIRSNRQF